MKKLFLFGFVCLLAACNHTINPEGNSDKLVLSKN